MIIDTHVHLDVFEGEVIPLEQRIIDLKASMRHAGIGKCIVLSCFGDDEIRFPTTERLVAALEGEKDICLAGTVRIRTYTRKHLKMLDKLLAEKKIIAMKLYPGYEDFCPTDRRCGPIYDLCAKHNVPVIIHTGETYFTKSAIQQANPIHIDEVALKRPNLRIVIAHMGNPWIDETMLILNRHRNVYSDISGIIWKSFDPFWTRHFSQMIIRTIKWCDRGNRLMLGTDWPCVDMRSYHTLMKDYVDFVKGLRISKEDKEKILQKNAREAFRI